MNEESLGNKIGHKCWVKPLFWREGNTHGGFVGVVKAFRRTEDDRTIEILVSDDSGECHWCDADYIIVD